MKTVSHFISSKISAAFIITNPRSLEWVSILLRNYFCSNLQSFPIKSLIDYFMTILQKDYWQFEIISILVFHAIVMNVQTYEFVWELATPFQALISVCMYSSNSMHLISPSYVECNLTRHSIVINSLERLCKLHFPT